jgi:hypothetical protein
MVYTVVINMNEANYDLSTTRKNPYAEKLKSGYSIRIYIPSEEEREKELNDFYVTDDELTMIKDFVASEEKKRGIR